MPKRPVLPRLLGPLGMHKCMPCGGVIGSRWDRAAVCGAGVGPGFRTHPGAAIGARPAVWGPGRRPFRQVAGTDCGGQGRPGDEPSVSRPAGGRSTTSSGGEPGSSRPPKRPPPVRDEKLLWRLWRPRLMIRRRLWLWRPHRQCCSGLAPCFGRRQRCPRGRRVWRCVGGVKAPWQWR